MVLKGAEVVFNFGNDGIESFKSFVIPPNTPPEMYLPFVNASPSDIVTSSSKEAFERKDRRLPLAVIVEPAKELAEQVQYIGDVINIMEIITFIGSIMIIN